MEGLVDKDGSDVVTTGGRPGEWKREWSFLIWTWTITTWNDFCFVETAQRRFLGQKVVKTYSKTLWKVIVWVVIIMAVAGIVSVFGLMYMVLPDANLGAYHFTVLGLACLLMGGGSAALAYFTFVPPKECRAPREP